MKYVIIGNSAAAIGAVEGIRQLDAANPITLIAAEARHTYARPLISYLLAGKISDAEMAYRPCNFYEKNGVRTRLGCKAVALDAGQKAVILAGGEVIHYDRLLIATGSKPVKPDIDGLDKKNVFNFYDMDDALALQSYCVPGMKAVVLGAGLTAVKAAEALTSLGVETTLLVRSRIMRNFLDQGAGAMLEKHLQKNGLLFAKGVPLQVEGQENATSVVLNDGRKLSCDLVVSATGVRANTELLDGSSLQVREGIVTGRDMQTSIAGIYAAGDVAEGYDMLLNCQRILPLLPVAYSQGETAGLNMAGGNAVYEGMGMNAVGFFGLPIISAGVIQENDANEVHLDVGDNYYRKLVFQGRHLTGFVLVEQIDRAGLLTWLIRERADVSPFKEKLLAGTFNNACLPEAVRLRRQAVVPAR